MEQQLVVFALGNEQYGVPIGSVESIIKMQQVTIMPHAPAYVQGVINLRGSILPVIDLRSRFGLESKDESSDSRIMVVSYDHQQVGLVVDSVSEVLTVSQESVQPPPPIATTVDSSFIIGIVKLDGRLVILLDLGRVLTLNDKASVDSVPTEA